MSEGGIAAPDRSRLLPVHVELLERFRRTMNLVGPGPVDEHYDDARQALAGLELSGRWADLGTGAGFPGVVLAALHPELQVDLVDSRQKRCAFLEEVLVRAGVDEGVRVVCDRIESLPDASYDGITARALAPPAQVLHHAARLLRPGGLLLLLLQATQPLPASPDFGAATTRPYAIDGKPRQAVLLTRR